VGTVERDGSVTLPCQNKSEQVADNDKLSYFFFKTISRQKSELNIYYNVTQLIIKRYKHWVGNDTVMKEKNRC